MKPYLSLCFPIILFCLLCSCLKSKDNSATQLPSETHIGANILACKINGQVFMSKGAGGKMSQGAGVLYEVYYPAYNQDSVAVIFASSSDPRGTITLTSKFSPAYGTFKIEPNYLSGGASYNSIVTDSLHGGYINYTYYNGDILAGTFAFDVAAGPDSVIHITEGRFDIENH